MHSLESCRLRVKRRRGIHDFVPVHFLEHDLYWLVTGSRSDDYWVLLDNVATQSTVRQYETERSSCQRCYGMPGLQHYAYSSHWAGWTISW